MDIEQIAEVCHEVNRIYCRAIGDNSQLSWSEAPEWQRSAAVAGVKFAIANSNAPASSQHDAWAADKVAEGWVYGSVKDAAAKTHPCIVPYQQLPREQRLKDALFQEVVRILTAAA